MSVLPYSPGRPPTLSPLHLQQKQGNRSTRPHQRIDRHRVTPIWTFTRNLHRLFTERHGPSIAISAGQHPTRHQEAISQAINDQSQIGFHHILRGFLATSWQTLASVHVNDSTKIETSKGQHRIRQALHAIHEFTREVWLGRNAALHEHKDTADALIYTAEESAELRHFHADPTLLPPSDRHYLTISLNKLLQSNPSVRRRWLRRVRNARANFVKEGRSQQTLVG